MAEQTDFDLVIRNGAVIDGTGAPAREADVAIRGAVIAQVGKVSGKGTREIDARGKIVTPGFIDIHTHYDGQAVWDNTMAPSSWHGVTTVVMGNCGVGFAPVRPKDRERLIELMEGVEDIPGACLHEGLDWAWETFDEYLGALERKPRDIDVCAQLSHGPLRVYVMGERALRLEPANKDDIRRMREIAAEAMRAGAVGFSTSRSILHKSSTGDKTPMYHALEDELTGIAMGLSDAGAGQFEFVSDWSQPDVETEFAMLRRVIEASGRPCVFSLNQEHGARNMMWRQLLQMSAQAVADGVTIRPVTAPRPIGSLFGLAGTQNPFSATPTFRSIAHLPLPELAARMAEPEVRERILSEDPYGDSRFPLWGRLGYDKMYERMFVLTDPPQYEPDRESSIASIARREGRKPTDVAYDVLIADGGTNFLFGTFGNFDGFNLDPTREMLSYPHVLPGLGDGGAHVGYITDASFPTYLLMWWGRDRAEGRMPLEDLVRRQTGDAAGSLGLADRGVLRAGMKADVNVIDFAKLGLAKPYVVHDLPAGGRRLLQKATGYVATIVSGVVTYRHGEATGELPGRLVRGIAKPEKEPTP